MSWYSKRSSRWWQDSENEWREKGAKDSSGTSETWSQSRGKARNEWASRNKGDWKGQSERSEWSQWSKEGEWREGEWSRSDKADWKTGEKSEIEKSQGQWAKTEPRVEVPPNPAASLEDALADVERLLGESLGSTRKLLDESHNSSKESVHLATRALELLTRQTADLKGDEDLKNAKHAKNALRELLMWRNFGSKMWLHSKPDPMNFQRYDAEVQNELKQTFSNIEQKLMQELIAGDSWSKLARKLRFCVGNDDFSGEMRALLSRVVNACERTKRSRQKRCVQVPMSEADEVAFEMMAADDAFGEQVIRDIRAVRAQFRQPEMAFGTYQAEGPAWMQHMLGWPIPGSDAISQASTAPGPQIPLPNLALNPWAEPFVEPWRKNFSASSSSAP